MSEQAKRGAAITCWCTCCQGREASCVGTAGDSGVWVLACDACCGHDGESGYCVPLSDVADLVQKRTKAWEEQRERADALEQQIAQVTRERDEARAAAAKPPARNELALAYAKWHESLNGGHVDE